MTEQELKALVLQALASVAPELVEAELDPDKSFRDQLDIDSMDFLNYVVALHNATGLEIPEADYPHLSTINGAVAYLARKLAAAPAR
jgi:acyl carrier protein